MDVMKSAPTPYSLKYHQFPAETTNYLSYKSQTCRNYEDVIMSLPESDHLKALAVISGLLPELRIFIIVA